MMKIPCKFPADENQKTEMLYGFILDFIPVQPGSPESETKILEIQVEENHYETFKIEGARVLAVIQVADRLITRPISELRITE
jgi:hypothetical protein